MPTLAWLAEMREANALNPSPKGRGAGVRGPAAPA